MISIVIPTLNAAAGLPPTLKALVPGIMNGVLREVILADGGSTDGTLEIADGAGLNIMHCEYGRGQQLHAGAEAAKSDWLLFLHSGTVLEAGWEEEAFTLIERVETSERAEEAAAFRFVLDDLGFRSRLVEWSLAWKCRIFGIPHGEQGLLISRRLYKHLGGYRTVPFEDVDLNHRITRTCRITILRTGAIANAERYKRESYMKYVLRL